jgi:NADH-quinone oxidoreductase subunit M
MVTMFVVTTLSVIGLPMLNGFVGEFLVLTGSMQSVFAHHTAWTVLATTGVILTASYMLWMIQRVFYGDLNFNTAEVAAPDLDAREHIALWPMVALMLLMGVVSPYWMRAIDTAGTYLAQQPPQPEPAAAQAAISNNTLDTQQQIPAAQEATK